MENLLLALLKPKVGPVGHDLSPIDRLKPQQGEKPSGFDRELDDTVRERRQGRAERPERSKNTEPSEKKTEPSEKTEHPKDTERSERTEPAGTADDAEPVAADAADDAAGDGTADKPETTAGQDQEPDAAEAAGASGGDSEVEKPDAVEVPGLIEVATKLGALKKAVAEKLARIAGIDDASETADAPPTDAIAGPAAITIAINAAKGVGAPSTITVTPGAGPDTVQFEPAGPAQGKPKAGTGQNLPQIETGTDDTGAEAGDDSAGDQPATKPGATPERSLAARAAFSAATAASPTQSQAQTPKPDFVSTLASSPTLDGVAGDGRGQPDTQIVTLRLTPVSHASKLSSIPVNTLAFHIARNFDKGINRFEIRLDPPELGRIDVRIEVDGDSRVRIHLTVERAEALDFLQRDARALERALADAGLDTDAESLSFSLDTGNQGADGEEKAALDGGPRPGLLQPIADDDEPAILPTHYVSSSGVDIRV